MFSYWSVAFTALPLVRGLSVQTPVGLTSGGQTTINWTTSAGDPASFSIELRNPAFHNSFAIANNVDPDLDSISLGIPIVPVGDGYNLDFVNISDINQIFASSGSFSIGPTVNASTTITGTTLGMSTTVTSLPSTASPVTGSATTQGSGGTNTGSGSAPTISTFNGNGNGAVSLSSGNLFTYSCLVLGVLSAALVV